MTWGIKKPLKGKFLYGSYLAYRGFSGRCLLYERLGIDSHTPRAINIRGDFEIDRPAAEVYAHWRNLDNLSGSIAHLMDVKVIDGELSHWKSNVLGNLFSFEWEAEIVKDEPGQLIGWRSTPGSLIQHVGRVKFEESPDGTGTLLKIVISYHPPIGGLGIGLAKVINPYFESLLKREIRSFKHTIEHQAPIL